MQLSPALAGFRFPPEVIVLAVRWYLRYGLSHREVEELLAECGFDSDEGERLGDGLVGGIGAGGPVDLVSSATASSWRPCVVARADGESA